MPKPIVYHGKVLERAGQRVVEPTEFKSHSPEDVIIPDKDLFREVYGPCFDGTIFKPLCRNIGTGDVHQKSHHSRGEGPRTRDSFLGCPPKYAFCLEWIELPEAGRVRCLNVMLVESGGCGTHPYCQGRGANIVFLKMKNDENIFWKDLMDPEQLREQQLLRQPAVNEKRLLMEKAEAEQLAPHEVFAAAALEEKRVAKAQAQKEEQEKQQLSKMQKGKRRDPDARRNTTTPGRQQKNNSQGGMASSERGLDKQAWKKKKADNSRKPWNDRRKGLPTV